MLLLQGKILFIDEFHHLIEINEQIIDIACKSYRYKVSGKQLKVKELMQGQIRIEGHIDCVMILYE